MAEQPPTGTAKRRIARIFLCGDLMTGRGIDQVLSDPCDPLIHESYVKSAADYVRLAEGAMGAHTDWLLLTLDRECQRLGTRVKLKPDGRLELSWRGNRRESSPAGSGAGKKLREGLPWHSDG